MAPEFCIYMDVALPEMSSALRIHQEPPSMSFTPSPLPVNSSRPDVPLPQSLGHAEVVALEHIDVEVQERRALRSLSV